MPIQGLQFTIPNNLERHQSYQATGSFIIYNPNDGICFIATDRTATTQSWDYKVPSQSGGRFPGPINSYLSVVYQDQSGGASTGQIVVYASADKVEIPHFWSIGRAVQTAGSIMDISQGTLPQNPPLNTVRLWADSNGDLHILSSTGADNLVYDSSNIGTVTLGGDLWGTIATGHVRLVYGNQISAYDSANNIHLLINQSGVNTTQIGSMGQGWTFINSAGNSNVITVTDAGAMSVLNSINASGSITAGPSFTGTAGDLSANRNNGTGYLFFANTSHYIGFDGTYYQLPNSPLNVGADIYGNNYHARGGALYLGASDQSLLQMWNPGEVRLSSSPGNFYTVGLINAGQGLVAGTNLTLNGSGYVIMNPGTDQSIYWAANSLMQISASGATPQFQFYAPNAGRYWNFILNASGYIQYGGTNVSISLPANGTQIIWASNGSYISGTAGYVQGSKREQKQNIVAVSDELMLSQVIDPRLGIYTYEWKEDERMGLGFMLDEVEQVLPAYVVRDEDGESTGYTTQELTVILWGAVRELANKVYGVKPT